MAPKSYPNTDPGRGAVLPNMPELLIAGVVKENFESFPPSSRSIANLTCFLEYGGSGGYFTA